MINKINLFFSLIKQGLPPILVTTAMYDVYTTYIANRDYKNFAQLIYISISQEMARWVSELRSSYHIEADSIEKLPFIK